MMKYLMKTLKVMITSLLILSVISAIILFTPLLLGLKSYQISSSSMSPVLNKGDIIYVKAVDAQKLKVGDIITFHMENSNLIVTHRISRIDKKNGLIYTIGDRNKSEDPNTITYTDIIGRYVNYKIPRLPFLTSNI